MSEWSTVRLRDLCSKIGSGATPTGGKTAYCDSGISLVRSQNVLDMSFSLDGLAHINEQQAKKLDGVTICEGDVLLNITGDSVARCCSVPTSVLPARVNQHVCIVRTNAEIASAKFIEYYLISIKPYLLTLASAGATRNALTKETIQQLEIHLPPLPTQRRIAAVLSALDDKIENNRKICETLEAQAQAIFKEWFVDFGPWGGKMPEGWRMGKLGDLATIARQNVNPQEMPDIVEHFSLPAYDTRRLPSYDLASSIKSNKFRISRDSILVSKLNPSIKRLWDPDVETDNAVSSTEFVVVEAKNKEHRSYVYSVLDDSAFYEYACSHAAGTTNSHQRISPDEILSYPTVTPGKDALDRFCNVTLPMRNMIKRLGRASAALSEMRDALLPKLMSGEIDVDKVEI